MNQCSPLPALLEHIHPHWWWRRAFAPVFLLQTTPPHSCWGQNTTHVWGHNSSLELILTAAVSNGRPLSAQLKSAWVADPLRRDFPGSPVARTPQHFHCRQVQSLVREQRYHVLCDLTNHPRHYVKTFKCRNPPHVRHNEISNGQLTWEWSRQARDPVFIETDSPHPQSLEV